MANGYIILKHQVFKEISDEEVIALLPKDQGYPVYKLFDIKREIIAMDNIHNLNWAEHRIYQKQLMDEEVIPYINEHPNHEVLYFGATPIPLALHLGYCLGSWKPATVFLLNREHGTWDWPTVKSTEVTTESSFVNEEFAGPIDVIYKVEVTYRLQDDDLKEAVQVPSKTISIKTTELGKDIIGSPALLNELAYQFALGIDAVANNLPNAEKIHLFPTLPVGLAFLMGTKINPLVTKPIVTYQYDINGTPKYTQALLLQEGENEEAEITSEEQATINSIKGELKAQIEGNITSLVTQKKEERTKRGETRFSWIQEILPRGNYSDMERGYWKSIPSIADTILDSSKLSLDVEKAGDSFDVSDERNEWQLNDRLVFNINKRLEEKAKTLRALRLFIFHEAIHIPQGLTSYTVPNIGRFPRVLEEADYIADVWAMVHEYAYSKQYLPSETADVKHFFLDMINVALNTILAFDDLDPNTDEMQVRRVNRYLIWMWNYLQIEDRACKNIEEIVELLANKPIIEIKGLDIRAQQQRTIFRLVNYQKAELELAYIGPDGIIRRTSNAGGVNIDEIVIGFKRRDLEMILKPLKAWHHQIRVRS